MIESPHFSDDEQIARLVRTTLQAATQPDNGRLKQLMPPLPTRRRRLLTAWQRQLALAGAAMIMCLGLFGLYQTGQQALWPGSAPTQVAITATFTSEPTATATDTAATSTAVVLQTAVATPAPPTPVAALPSATARNSLTIIR